MTTTRRYPAATKNRRPTPLGLREAVQKKPHIELHSSTTHYAKLSLAGEVGASGRCEASSRAPGAGSLLWGNPTAETPSPQPSPAGGGGTAPSPARELHFERDSLTPPRPGSGAG
nr:hypothetical protein BDOA9_0126060 [Bradyrhizobium sp. DOA9]